MSDPTPPKQLFVRNRFVGSKLPSLQVLSIYFSKFGRVVKIIDGNMDRTFAFVTFQTAEQAKAAFDAINGSEVVDASNGVNLGQTLFVDFAVERGAKPVHVKAPKPAPAPRPAHLEAPKPASAPRPAHLEAPKLAPAPRPAPLEAPKSALVQIPASLEAPKSALVQIPAPSQKPDLDVESVALLMVYISQSQKPRMMSKSGLALLFHLGLYPETKFQGYIPVEMFGDGDEWVIPYPEHPTATQDCQKAFDSGTYTEKLTVNIPKGVLESKKFWRD